MNFVQEHLSEAGKATPPVAVSVSDLVFKMPISDVVYWATLVYTVLMIFGLIRKYFWAYKARESDPACAQDCPLAQRLRDRK